MRNVLSKITKAGVVDEKMVKEIVKDIQRILISSDVNVKLVQKISKNIEQKALSEKLPPGVSRKEHLTKIIYDEMVEILGGEIHNPRMDKHKVLLVGLFGSGKTTTIAKLAAFYSKRGLKTCMITTDTWRQAAFEQVQQLGEQIKVTVLGEKKKNALDILKSALPETKNYDLILVDSAGRDSLNKELLDEIKAVKKELQPDEIYLVISADIGQTAAVQAEKFNDVLGGLTGVIVTKADSSGKAGGALSACSTVDVPVTFVGTGEKMADFEIFDAKKFVSRLLGFPDLGSLLKKVKDAVEESEFSPEDILKEEYTLKTFYKQLEATKKMGPLSKVFEMMGAGNLPEKLVHTSEEKLKTYKVMMDSMTEEELHNPELIKAPRIKRIAKGSGRSESEVKELLKQFNMGKKMIKKLKKGKIKGLPDMMKRFGGKKRAF
jgi:signal recognition particle subunit SRP54